MTKIKGLKLAFLIFLFQMPFSTFGQGVETIAAGATVNSVFSGIAEDLKGLIEQTEDSTNVVVMKSRIQASILLNNLEIIANNYTDKVFSQLNDSQKQAFINARQLLDDWNNGNLKSLDKLEELNNSVSATLSMIPGFKTEPRVLTFAPAYVVENLAKAQRITIDGQWLDYGEPTLVLGGKACKRITKLSPKLEFECTGLIFSSEGSMQTLVGILTVYREPDFLEWIKSFFSEGSKSQRVYEISLTGVPGTIGNYRVVANVDTEVIDTKDREQTFYHRNDHCSGGRTMSWSAQPARGYEIDVTSVRHSVTRSSRSSLNYVTPSSAAIDIQGRVVNSGNCGPRIPFSRERAYYDGRGALGVSVKWKDIKRKTTVVPKDVGTGLIVWRKDLSIELPQEMRSFLLTVEHPDGSVTSADHVGTYTWFKVEKNGVALVIRPNDPKEVFGG